MLINVSVQVVFLALAYGSPLDAGTSVWMNWLIVGVIPVVWVVLYLMPVSLRRLDVDCATGTTTAPIQTEPYPIQTEPYPIQSEPYPIQTDRRCDAHPQAQPHAAHNPLSSPEAVRDFAAAD
jgi:hypothetical protein